MGPAITTVWNTISRRRGAKVTALLGREVPKITCNLVVNDLLFYFLQCAKSDKNID